jgi:hypothetical protein
MNHVTAYVLRYYQADDKLVHESVPYTESYMSLEWQGRRILRERKDLHRIDLVDINTNIVARILYQDEAKVCPMCRKMKGNER